MSPRKNDNIHYYSNVLWIFHAVSANKNDDNIDADSLK